MIYINNIINTSIFSITESRSIMLFKNNLLHLDFSGNTKYYLFLSFFIISILLITSLKKVYDKNKKSILELNELVPTEKQFQLLFLTIGIALPVYEILLEIFKIRQISLFYINIPFGLLLIFIFYLSLKVKIINKNINYIFITIFYSYYSFILSNLIFKPFDDVSYTSLIIIYFLSYFVFKKFINYLFFSGLYLSIIFLFIFFNIIEFKKCIILIGTYSITLAIHFARHFAFENNKNNFEYINQIVNNSDSISLVTNKKGEVLFCSKSIDKILGWNKNEVIGLNFWKLTEDSEFIGEKYHENYIDNRTYTRKLKCKDGSFKYIQWRDKKISDTIVVGVGQDITEKHLIQVKYKSLIENASDLIYELDTKGNYTFVNNYLEKITGYTFNELKNKHFSEFIHPEYLEKVLNYYNPKLEVYDSLEFPILSKNGEIIWLSQNVSRIISKDRTIGFSVIARNITLQKNLEIENNKRTKKNKRYNEVLKTLMRKSSLIEINLDEYNFNLLKEVSKTIDVNRVSIWLYETDKIICENQYIQNKNIYTNGIVLTKKDFPIYFDFIEKELQIIANDVYNEVSTKEFCTNYFPENNIKSMLDTPFFINGELKGIICLESDTKIKNWDLEDQNFMRSVADLVSLALESNSRLLIEKRLSYKSKLLFEVNNLTEKIVTFKDNNQIINEVVHSIGEVLNLDRLTFYELDYKNKLVNQKFRWLKTEPNSNNNLNPELLNLPLEQFENIVNQINSNGNYYCNIDEITHVPTKNFFEKLSVKTILLLPLKLDQQITGCFAFDNSENKRNWTDDEIYIVTSLINNISYAIEKNKKITELFESEEKFKLIANNIPGTVYLTLFDEKSTKIYINDEIKNLTGYSKEEFLKNTISILDIIHPDDKDIVLSQQLEKLKDKKAIHSIYRIIQKNGKIKWVEEFGDVILKDNKIEFIGGVYFDITEKKKTEDAIKEKQLAEAANKSKSEFLANMSHEIRTPLNGIIGFSDLLINTELNDSQKNYMLTINQSAKSLMEIVNDILDFSKIESGKLELEITKVDLRMIINEVINLFEFNAKNKNIKLILDINDNVPNYLWIDVLRLKQILINLISNALKFTEKGSITLKIENISNVNETYNIFFSVKDTGIGIEKRFQNKIFEAFSQGDTSTTRKYGGTGLGLTITNNILKLNKSKLHLKSEVNKGSEFYFTLRVKGSNEKINDLQNIQNINKNEDFFVKPIDNHKNYKILIVEDNKINLLLAKTLVKQIIPNVSIFEAENGQIAVDQFELIKPDLILMDVQMPILNGYEATQAIRSKPSGKFIPIIALTAGTVSGEKEKCIELGMNDFVSKPIIKEILQTSILKWINH